MEPHNIEHVIPVFIAFGCLVAVFICVLVAVIKVWVFCRICSKAGYSWALGLLMLVPIANIIIPLFLAFSDWPISKQLRGLKEPRLEAGG